MVVRNLQNSNDTSWVKKITFAKRHIHLNVNSINRSESNDLRCVILCLRYSHMKRYESESMINTCNPIESND